jgi:hypothetical protein
MAYVVSEKYPDFADWGAEVRVNMAPIYSEGPTFSYKPTFSDYVTAIAVPIGSDNEAEKVQAGDMIYDRMMTEFEDYDDYAIIHGITIGANFYNPVNGEFIQAFLHTDGVFIDAGSIEDIDVPEEVINDTLCDLVIRAIESRRGWDDPGMYRLREVEDCRIDDGGPVTLNEARFLVGQANGRITSDRKRTTSRENKIRSIAEGKNPGGRPKGRA